MLDGGEDIEFIARRLIISASEDIGNADPRALQVATSAHYGIKQIGMPEARIILAQATSYLANAPKSNSSYLAINEALNYVKNNPTVEVPTHLRNHHPDKKNYKYSHSYPNHYVDQDYLPKDKNLHFYESSNIAYEKMQEDYLNKIKKYHNTINYSKN
jgi:putative ATPase